MKKLRQPNINPSVMLSECIQNVSDGPTQSHYIANLGHIEVGIVDFDNASTTTAWCNLPRVPNGHNDRIITGDLTKGQLTKLYSYYMLKDGSAARGRYDEIKVAANGLCPFCGGIGHVKTLDHYLPKANFPLYSVTPANLVPCCRDCNSGKSNSFPEHVHLQTIHPYMDGDHFFSQKWTHADIIKTEPVTARFEAHPPTNWSDSDKQRAANHFLEYDLASRYSVEAATEIASLAYLRRTIFRGHSTEGFTDYLTEQGQSPNSPINGWKRTLYFALAETDWFCKAVF